MRFWGIKRKNREFRIILPFENGFPAPGPKGGSGQEPGWMRNRCAGLQQRLRCFTKDAIDVTVQSSEVFLMLAADDVGTPGQGQPPT